MLFKLKDSWNKVFNVIKPLIYYLSSLLRIGNKYKFIPRLSKYTHIISHVFIIFFNFCYKGVPSSKTKYDIISDRERVPWGKNFKK
jgi:hypothetical protein